MKFQANIPLQAKPGLISPGLAKAYRSIVGELGRGAEDPSRELGLRSEEGAVTGATRMLKLYALDYPAEFLRLGGKGIEDSSSLSAGELLELAGGAISGGIPGGGLGPASMAGRVPLKGFFSPLQKGIRELIKEGTTAGTALTKGGIRKPGQTLLNLLKKKGISGEELRFTGVEKLLAGGQKPIPLKDVMKQAIGKEIKVEPKTFRPRSVQAEQKLNKLGKEKDALWREFQRETSKRGTSPGRFAESGLAGEEPVLDDIFKRFKEKRRELTEFSQAGGSEKLLELSTRESKLTNLGRPITETEHKELISVRKQIQQVKQSFPQYADPAYRKPFQPSLDIPYEETLLTLKGRGRKFKDPSHYQDVEDLIAWSRSEVRPGESGEKVRLIQEVQESDWGIKGRREGFGKPTEKDIQEVRLLEEKVATTGELTTEEGQKLFGLKGRVPQTPFKKDAIKLMLKKELFEAASDPSVTHLGWTSGAMQAYERWPAPEAEKKLLQLYDEIIPGFLKKQTRRLGKGKEGVREEVKVLEAPAKAPKPIEKRLQQQFFDRYGRKPMPIERKPFYQKVPTIKMEDWLRKAILKGQRIAKIDQAPFKEFMYG